MYELTVDLDLVSQSDDLNTLLNEVAKLLGKTTLTLGQRRGLFSNIGLNAKGKRIQINAPSMSMAA